MRAFIQSRNSERIVYGNHTGVRIPIKNTQYQKKVRSLRVTSVQLVNMFPSLNEYKLQRLKKSGWEFKLVFSGSEVSFQPPATSIFKGGVTGNPGFQNLYQLCEYLSTFVEVGGTNHIWDSGYFAAKNGLVYFMWTSTSAPPVLIEFPQWMGQSTEDNPDYLDILPEATQYPIVTHYDTSSQQILTMSTSIQVRTNTIQSLILCIGPYENMLEMPWSVGHAFEQIPLVAQYMEINHWSNPYIDDPLTSGLVKVSPEIGMSTFIDVFLMDQHGTPVNYQWERYPILIEIDFFFKTDSSIE